METEIRGSATNRDRMVIGQMRKVFQPFWIHAFEGGQQYTLKVAFRQEPDCEEEFVRFLEMHGYSLQKTETKKWVEYFFR